MTFDQIYIKYRDKVFSYIYSRIMIHEDAEDLTDTVFYKCYKNFDNYNSEKASVSTWIYTVTSNTLKNYYRDKKTYISLDSPEMFEISDESQSDIMQAVCYDEMRNDLAKALDTLPEKNKKIIIMRYFQKKSCSEIGNIIGESEGNIRVIISRTLKKLKKYFDDNNIEINI